MWKFCLGSTVLILSYLSISVNEIYALDDFGLTNVVSPNNQDTPINRPGIEQTPYVLGAGDVISFDILNIPEYSKTYQVLIDGTINLPLIDRLKVAGLTPAEVQKLTTKIYTQKKLLVNPIITVNLLSPRPINVAVVGDVRNPGSYVIPFRTSFKDNREKDALEFPSLIDALKIAQGINASADDDRIQVIREFKGKKRVYLLSLKQFLTQGDLSQDIILRDGDRIVVPSAKTIDLQSIRRRAQADFSANLNIPVSINIIGEVNRPGPYTLNPENIQSGRLNDQLNVDTNTKTNKGEGVRFSTITTAIRFSGGLTGKADIRNIQVKRIFANGKEQIIKADLWQLLQGGDLNQDTLLQEGDTIIIPTATDINVEESAQVGVASFSPNSVNINVVGEVKKPGIQQLPPNITLQQAILAAGGFDDQRATQGEVELVRLNANGTVTRMPIKVNFQADVVNSENNPSLLNNDIVVVKRNALTKTGDFLGTLSTPIGQFLNLITPFILLSR